MKKKSAVGKKTKSVRDLAKEFEKAGKNIHYSAASREFKELVYQLLWYQSVLLSGALAVDTDKNGHNDILRNLVRPSGATLFGRMKNMWQTEETKCTK